MGFVSSNKPPESIENTYYGFSAIDGFDGSGTNNPVDSLGQDRPLRESQGFQMKVFYFYSFPYIRNSSKRFDELPLMVYDSEKHIG